VEPEEVVKALVPEIAEPEDRAEPIAQTIAEPLVFADAVVPESAFAQPDPAPVELPTPSVPRKHKRHRRWLKAGAMTLQAAALLLAMAVTLITVLPALFGARSLVVAGSSMEPTVPKGSVVFVQPMPPTAARIGDIVTFAADGDPNNLVTHRVVQVEQDDQGLALRTEGDANNTEDVWRVRANDTVGKVVMWLPAVGYLVSAASLPAVRIATLALLLVTLAAQVLRRKPAPQPSVSAVPALS
jgi:signal peptidase